MDKTYIEFVCELIRHQKIGEPIYVRTISKHLAESYSISLEKASAATSVAVKRIMDTNLIPELRFYQKGIYYLITITPFGETGINKEQLIEDKYLKNNSGYETGLITLHRLGLISQIPNERVLATNKAKECSRKDRKLEVVIRPPKVEITADNKQYLKFLDMLEIIEVSPIDTDRPYKILSAYAEKLGLEYKKLLFLADNYYNQNTIIQLAHVAGKRT